MDFPLFGCRSASENARVSILGHLYNYFEMETSASWVNGEWRNEDFSVCFSVLLCM